MTATGETPTQSPTGSASQFQPRNDGIFVKRVGLSGEVGRIYLPKSLVATTVTIIPHSEGVNPRSFLEALFGHRMTDILLSDHQKENVNAPPAEQT